MIVQCDQCNARFRLDDSKIKEGGVKVRCSKCKNIFTVAPKLPAEEPDFDSLLSGLMSPPSDSAEGAGKPEPVAAGAVPAAAHGTEPEIPAKETPSVSGKEEFDLSEFTFNEESMHVPSAPPSADEVAGGGSDLSVFGELDMSGLQRDQPAPEFPEDGEKPVSHQEFEFTDTMSSSPVPDFELNIKSEGFFEESSGPESPFSTLGGNAEQVATPETFSFEPEPVTRESIPVEEKPSPDVAAGFSFEEENAFSFSPGAPEGQHEPAKPEPFDFGDFSFDEHGPQEKDGIAQQQPASHEVGGEGASLEEISTPEISDLLFDEGEPPPLSISTRRRGGSALPIAVTAISVLLVLLLAGGGYYIFKQGPSALNKVGLGFLAKWFGGAGKEEKGIVIRNSVGSFLNNAEAGEIFAVTGEAVNNFGKPRASIQVKAVMYGPKGEVVLQKTAYCGNVLSKEQLATLPMAKLEAAMNNQFGDSLSNLAVQTGKAIPFVIVFSNVPKEVVEFGVEIVGSTVAGQ